MRTKKVLPLIAVLAAALAARADDPRPSRAELVPLTWETYATVLADTAVAPEEIRWDRVRWKSSVFDGLVEGQARDKPLFIFMFNGDVRAVC